MFFHCLVYCFGLTAFCMWFNKGQAAWFGLAWLPVVCEKYVICHQNLLESALIFMFLQCLWEEKRLHQKDLGTFALLDFPF